MRIGLGRRAEEPRYICGQGRHFSNACHFSKACAMNRSAFENAMRATSASSHYTDSQGAPHNPGGKRKAEGIADAPPALLEVARQLAQDVTAVRVATNFDPRRATLRTTHTEQMQLPPALRQVATQLTKEICCPRPAKRQATLRTTPHGTDAALGRCISGHEAQWR